MPDNNELVNMLRVVIQEELKPINERLDRAEQGQQEFRKEVNTRFATLEAGQQGFRKEVNTRLVTLEAGQQGFRKEVNTRLANLEAGQQELKEGQTTIETTLNDLRAINRRTHKEVFNQLNAIWDDIKLLSSQGEKAIR
jgi:uncharacterized protein (UPF0335 family)